MRIGTASDSHQDTDGNMRSDQPKPLIVLSSNWMISNGLLSQDQVLGWARYMQQREAADAIDSLFGENNHEYERFVLAQKGIVRIGTKTANKPAQSDHTSAVNEGIPNVPHVPNPDRSMGRFGGLDLLASSFASDAAASLTRKEWEDAFQQFKSNYSEDLCGADNNEWVEWVRPDDIPYYRQMWYATALPAGTRRALNMLIGVGLRELKDVVVMRHPATHLVLKRTGLSMAKLVLRVMRAEEQMRRLVVLYYLEKLKSETARQDAVRFAVFFKLGHYLDIHRFETAALSRQAERKS